MYRPENPIDVAQQETYYEQLLHGFVQLDTAEVVGLPGVNTDQNGTNTLQLGQADLENFGRLPGGAAFEQEFNGPPRLVMFLGQYSILALTRYHDPDAPTEALPQVGSGPRHTMNDTARQGNPGHSLVALYYNGTEEILSIPPNDTRSMLITRDLLDANTSLPVPDMFVSNPHVAIFNHGADWTVQDMGSRNGTFCAVPRDSYRLGYGAFRDDDTAILTPDDLSVMPEMPAIHRSMRIRPPHRHRRADNQ